MGVDQLLLVWRAGEGGGRGGWGVREVGGESGWAREERERERVDGGAGSGWWEVLMAECGRLAL